jgi:arylsulfatase A-like enzyme
MSPLLGILFAAVSTLTSAEKPNVVFIIADDLGWADVAFHGGIVPTPNLDRLKAEGVELTRHYVAPVCSPTRSALMTGRCWSRFGVTTPQNDQALPFDTVTLPRALKECGYDTAITGKWHLGSKPEWGPNHFGFDHSYGSLAGGVGPYDHRYKKGEYSVTWHRNGELIEEEGHVTDLIADEAVKWIGERGEAPFLLYVPFTAVHLPVKEPQEWLDRVPASITGEVPRHYAACIAHLDDAVGRIVRAIDDSGRGEKTLIVFTSDNGGSTSENNDTKYPADGYPQGTLPGNNAPWRGKKGDLYEGGIRVPTLARWTGTIPAASTCDALLHISDWMPTIAALAGFEGGLALKWDGIDAWPAISGKGTVPDRVIYSAGPGFRARALHHGDWKLIVREGSKGAGETNELFDLGGDPAEARDLSSLEAGKLAEMKARLDAAARADRDAVVAKPGG